MNAPRARVTEAEYLAYDLEHEGRHEFLNGVVVPRDAVSPRHDRVVTNLLVAISTRLRAGPGRASTAHLRVRIDETGLYAYPDMTVTCGPPEFADTRPRTLLNPTMLVEVRSPSTAGWDAVKAAHYRNRGSVRAYLLVSIPDRRVELYERQADGWLLRTSPATRPSRWGRSRPSCR